MRNGRLVHAGFHKANSVRSHDDDSDEESDVSFYDLCGGTGVPLPIHSSNLKTEHLSKEGTTKFKYKSPPVVEICTPLFHSNLNKSKITRSCTLSPIYKGMSEDVRSILCHTDVFMSAQSNRWLNNIPTDKVTYSPNQCLSHGRIRWNMCRQSKYSDGRNIYSPNLLKLSTGKDSFDSITRGSTEALAQRMSSVYRERSNTYSCTNYSPLSKELRKRIPNTPTGHRKRSGTFPREIKNRADTRT